MTAGSRAILKETAHFSAGGVVLRHASDNRTEVLIIQHRKSRGWGFPKGWIEEGETPPQTALREVEEETGVIAEILTDLPQTSYKFVIKGRERVSKTVTWYLMRYAGEGNHTHAHEISALEWMPLEMVHARLTHQNDKDLFAVALKTLQTVSW